MYGERTGKPLSLDQGKICEANFFSTEHIGEISPLTFKFAVCSHHGKGAG